MTLKSMTGFARSDGHHQNINWHWEVRTLNGRGLDIRLRLPQGYEALDQPVREACGKALVRGNCSISLNVKREGNVGEIRLNEQALNQVLSAVKLVEDKVDAKRPSLDGILSLRGVLEVCEPEEDEGAQAARVTAILQDFLSVLDRLSNARAEEGARLSQAISSQIDQIETLVLKAERSPSRTSDAIKARLQDQVTRLLDTENSNSFSEERLHQEALLLAAKSDIEEEIERLKSHIIAARELVVSKKPAGRRLDFLTQELNREANTICSKANDNEISHIGLELKAVIDQMREQVQNIE